MTPTITFYGHDFTRVTFETRGPNFDLHFRGETLVAFRAKGIFYCAENIWGDVPGSQNQNKAKTERLDRIDFNRAFNRAIKGIKWA